MANPFIRVQIDLTNIEGAPDKYVWLPVFPNSLSTIQHFKTNLYSEFNLNQEKLINLYIQGCLLRDKDTILLLRDNDIVKVLYESSITDTGRNFETFSFRSEKRKRNKGDDHAPTPDTEQSESLKAKKKNDMGNYSKASSSVTNETYTNQDTSPALDNWANASGSQVSQRQNKSNGNNKTTGKKPKRRLFSTDVVLGENNDGNNYNCYTSYNYPAHEYNYTSKSHQHSKKKRHDNLLNFPSVSKSGSKSPYTPLDRKKNSKKVQTDTKEIPNDLFPNPVEMAQCVSTPLGGCYSAPHIYEGCRFETENISLDNNSLHVRKKKERYTCSEKKGLKLHYLSYMDNIDKQIYADNQNSSVDNNKHSVSASYDNKIFTNKYDPPMKRGKTENVKLYEGPQIEVFESRPINDGNKNIEPDRIPFVEQASENFPINTQNIDIDKDPDTIKEKEISTDVQSMFTSTPNSCGNNNNDSNKSEILHTNNCPKKKRNRKRIRKKIIQNGGVVECNLNTNAENSSTIVEPFGLKRDYVQNKPNQGRKHIRFSVDSEISNASLKHKENLCLANISNNNDEECIDLTTSVETKVDEALTLCQEVTRPETPADNVVIPQVRPTVPVQSTENSSNFFKYSGSPSKEKPNQEQDRSPSHLLNSVPAVGTNIAFKVLELSSFYCPEVSDYKKGTVINIDPVTDKVEIKLFSEELKTPFYGKFENIYPSDDSGKNPEVIQTMKLLWTEVIEPKLLPM